MWRPAAAFFLSGLAALCSSVDGPGHEHPAPGTSIVRFAQLDKGVYKGSTPRNDADFAFLESKHIRYILNLRFLPFLNAKEKRKARQHGITYLSVFMNASPLAPSAKHVNHILRTIDDPCYQPIYFHCDIGRDRTSLVATLYEMYFHNLPESDATRRMKEYGFKDSWTLRGLKKYLRKYSIRPESLNPESLNKGEHSCASTS
jgi:hypothetical protein